MGVYAVEDLRGPRKSVVQTGTWQGVVAVGASDMGDRIFVVIPDLAKDTRIGPCRWQSRDDHSHPARGDECLIQFDNRNEPWIVAWWPFAT